MHTDNLFLIGLMGSGKSAVGKSLADQIGYQFFDSDRVIEQRVNANIRWIFDEEGEEGFRKREAVVIDELTQLSRVVVATGGGAILGVDNRRHLRSRGTVVFLDPDLDVLVRRVRRNSQRPLLDGGDVESTLYRLLREREDLYRETADLRLYVTRSDSVRSITQRITDWLDKR